MVLQAFCKKILRIPSWDCEKLSQSLSNNFKTLIVSKLTLSSANKFPRIKTYLFHKLKKNNR